MTMSWGTSPPSGVENTGDFTSNTDVRDVSSMLDAVYIADTPLVNRIGYGSAIKNKVHEWITDEIGGGYLVMCNAAAIASNASVMICGTMGYGAASIPLRQINTGTILKYEGASADVGWYVVTDFSYAGSITYMAMTGTTYGSDISSIATFFIVGNAVTEGSTPRRDQTRPRVILTNRTQIFRQDIRMTGTRQAIEMYGVPNELRKQITLRTMEHKRQVERSVILGFGDTGDTTAEANTMTGIYHYLSGQSGSHIDQSTTTLTETKINDVAQAVFDAGGEPNTLLLGAKQARVIPTLERARVRVTQDSKKAGFYVTKYMTDLGVEMDILISRWVPKHYTFVLDINKLELMPLRGRKFILQKLGLVGDYIQYQLISEITLEFRGYTLGQHGMFDSLT